MTDLRNIETWHTRLGLMPVSLLPEAAGSHRAYVLLNGARGNFCVDLNPPSASPDRRSQAWSANVGHFVTVLDDHVKVQRWNAAPDEYIVRSADSVRDDLQGFHNELERLSPPTDQSVIAHAVRVFRSMRTALGPQVDGKRALDAFLYLLASAVDDFDNGVVRSSEWWIPAEIDGVVSLLEDAAWGDFRLELTRGLPLHQLRPDLRIVLRHAAGPLFQEAHYLAQFAEYQQSTLPGLGFVPEPAALVKSSDGIGSYFTPSALARTIVEECLAASTRTQHIRIFDPACGSGEFLREALRQLRIKDYRGEVHILGWDISAAACAMSRFILAWETRGAANVRWKVDQRDALDSQWPNDVDVILMNPPFVSVRKMTHSQKASVLSTLGDLARSRYELSSAFLWKAATALQPGGIMGTVVPASLLEGESFAELRGALAKQLTAHLIARLGSQELFQQAQVDAGVYIARKNGGHGVPIAVWADHRLSSSSAALRSLRRMRALSHFETVAEPSFSVYWNPEIGSGKEGWAPRPFHEWSFRRRAASLPKVAELFDVRQGTLTGYNKAFVVSAEYLYGLAESEQLFFRKAVLNESVQEGRLNNHWYVFFPYGDYRIATERQLRQKLPTFFRDRLEPHRAALAQRRLPESTQWWELTRPRQWQIKPTSKLVSTYFGGRGSFAWDEDGEYVVVQGYAWQPKHRKRSADRAVWLAWLALLNSPLFEDLLKATSDNVGGGQWNLSIRYVRRIPVPNLPVEGERSRITDGLAKLGSLIHDGGLGVLTPSQLYALRELIEAAYGVEGPPP